MTKRFEFSIVAKFRDLASRGIRGLGRTARRSFFGSRGILGSFGLGRLATGGIFGAVVGAARAAVGSVLGIVRGGVNLAVGIIRVGVRIIAGILRTVVKVAAGVGLAAGGLLGWQLVKGIRENMKLADIRMVLRKLLGDAAKDAEQYARQLSLRTPFTPMQMLKATAGLAAVRASYKRFLSDLADWSAGAQVPLEQILTIFQRATTGQFGEAMEGARRALISMRDLQREGATFTGAGQFKGSPEQFVAYLMAAVQRRFAGMAAAAATVGGGPLSTFAGAVQDLRIQLSEPWYERFNRALIDMNAWLLKIVKEEGFKKLAAWSEQWADVLDTKLRGALGWLTGMDWSAEGFKRFLNVIREEAGALLTDIKASLPDLWAFVQSGAKGVYDYAVLLVARLAAEIESQIGGTLSRFAGVLMQRGAGQMGAATGPGAGIGQGKPWYQRPLTLPLQWLIGARLKPGMAAKFKAGEAMFGAGKGLQALVAGMQKAAENEGRLAAQSDRSWAAAQQALDQFLEGQADHERRLRNFERRIKALSTARN